ncbi:MAG: hypothetical protein INH41_22695 [Myxococcaceae bacterium]|jgi:hypothetical protein|nr:hypothetical protein [Myxococcaceae bacterium]MCA3015207.1 hypothetical protein [Myxococcaceae bacterium]
MAPPPRALQLFLGLWLLQASAYFMPGATWNPVSRLALTHALVDEGTLRIDDFADATGDRARVGDHWYSDKSPMVSFAAAPAYALVRGVHQRFDRPPPTFTVLKTTPAIPAIRVEPNRTFAQLLYVCAVAVGGVPFALLGVLLVRFLARRFSLEAALVGTAVTLLGTPLYPYASSLYGHVLATCALFLAVELVDAEPHPSPARWLAAGAALGLAVTTEYLLALPGAVLAGWVTLGHPARARPTVRVLCLGLGAAGPVGLLAAYNTACFGAPWRTGYHFVVLDVFVEGHARGLMGVGAPTLEALWGLWFSPSRGLAVVAPVTLLAVVGLAVALRRRRTDRALVALTLAFGVLFVANGGYYMWWGGAAAGPRHLLPGLPVLGAGIAATWELRRARPLTAALALTSITVMVLFAAVGTEAPEHAPVLSRYLWPAYATGRLAAHAGASNLGVRLGLPVAGSLGPLLAWLLVGGRGLLRLTRDVAPRVASPGAGPALEATTMNP